MEMERQQLSSASGRYPQQLIYSTHTSCFPPRDYPRDEDAMRYPCDESFGDEGVELLRAGYGQFDLPLVAYARLHGLTTDYLSQHPLTSDLCPGLPADWKSDLEDPEGTPNIGLLVSLGALNGRTLHEKLDIDKDTAELLSSVFKLAQSDDTLDEPVYSYTPSLRDLKIEEPMLMSDAELDLMRLVRHNTVTISSNGMRPFPKDEIQDPGFLGLQKDAAMLGDLEKRTDEKLDIDRSTMQYINDICSELSLDGHDDMETPLLGRKVNLTSCSFTIKANMNMTRFPSLETPPLMPSSPLRGLEAPSAEAIDMDLTSSPEDLFQKEAAALEQQILARDSTPFQEPPGADEQQIIDPSIYTFPGSETESSSSPIPRKRLQNLKVETPLTPEDYLEPPAKKAKTVSFSADLFTMIPTMESGVANSDGDLPGDDDLTPFIEKVVQPYAESAIKQVEQEQIDELDTTLRVNVPDIDDLELAVPWKTSSDRTNRIDLATQTTVLSQFKNELRQSESEWSGLSKTEKHLPWVPFPPELGKIKVEEEFDDGSLASYLTELVSDDDLDVDSLICEPVIRIMVEDDDDDLLEPFEYDLEEDCPTEDKTRIETSAPTLVKSQVAAVLPVQKIQIPEPGRLDMQALLKKRKLELEAASNKCQAIDPPPDNASSTNSASRPDRPGRPRPALVKDVTGAAGGLANFIHLHGGAVPTTKPSQSAPEHHQPHDPPASAMAPSKKAYPVAFKQQSFALPLPAIADMPAPFSVVISSTFLSNRELMRELRRTLSGLAIVERDVLPTTSMKAGTESGVNYEADITASPGTGVITTTMQKLRQKPLPGQTAFFGIRDRTSLVCSRYSRLVVLVSQGRQPSDEDGTSTGPLDRRDVQTISDLVGFACSLENDVEIQFVAGGERELARWLAGVISRTVLYDYDGKLLEEETLWERFLRQAGLNPFAAQYVLSKLKPTETPTNVDTSSVSGASSTGTFGLAAFVQMTTAQRVEVFGQAVGRRVLKRVSEVMDGGWVSVVQEQVHREQHRMGLLQ